MSGSIQGTVGYQVNLPNFLRDFPVFACYVLFPISLLAAKYLHLDVPRNWIDVLWAGLAFLSLVVVVHRRYLALPARWGWAVLGGLSLACGLMIAKVMLSLSSGNLVLPPFAMEIKPFFYLGVAVLWVGAFGAAKPKAFVGGGTMLALMVCADFFLESYLAGGPVRVTLTGDPNYDACLLLIAFCVVLFGADEKPSSAIVALLIAGLLITMSRTTLVAAIAIILFFAPFSSRSKVIFSSAAVLAIILSFVLRGLSLDSLNQMDRYWMWLAAVDLFSSHPWHMFVGFHVGHPLPATIPRPIAELWSMQESDWGISGIFAYNFHAFWLRFAITWGVVIAGLVAASFAYAFLNRQNSTLLRALALLVLVMGLTMGTFYLSNVALPLYLALWSAVLYRFRIKSPNGAALGGVTVAGRLE